MMQMRCPSAVQLIPRTVLLFRLLIISSNHFPLFSIHTMMRPFWSEVVSLRNFSFQHTQTTELLWPSSVFFFIDRLGGPPPPFLSAPPPPFLSTPPRLASSFRTLRRPFSPPHTIQPLTPFHDNDLRREVDGVVAAELDEVRLCPMPT